MSAIFCRRRVRVLLRGSVFAGQRFWAHQNVVLSKSLSSEEYIPNVCQNDSEKSFTVSYLINSCGLSSNDAVSVSKKLGLKSPEKPDAVLKLLKEYGFADAHILRLVTGWPNVLLACPERTLLPKLEFFHCIGVPLPLLAQKLSAEPSILTRSLKKSLLPVYSYLRSILQSDKKVVHVFSRAPCTFGRCRSEGVSSNISMLRERGMPESSIVSLVMHPRSLLVAEEKLAVYVDRAVEMGFDMSKRLFVHAIRVFIDLGEPNLKHKMEVYRRCGWSESDIITAFLRYPNCMNVSEKKIMTNMNFLMNKMGCKRAAIARCPMLLSYSLDRRIKPRCLVVRILNRKGLLKKTTSCTTTLMKMSEDKFLKRYVAKYEKDIPELLDIYRGKSRPPEMGSSPEVSSQVLQDV